MTLLLGVSVACAMVAAYHLATLGLGRRRKRDRLLTAVGWLTAAWLAGLAVSTFLLGR